MTLKDLIAIIVLSLFIVLVLVDKLTGKVKVKTHG